MAPEFSSQPGRYERHVQRKYNNVLFPKEERQVTQDHVVTARELDEEELQQFSQTYHTILQEIVELAQNVESELVLKLKQRLDQLYEQVCGLGGDRTAEKAGLAKLHQAIDQAIAAGAAGDATAEAQLAQEARARKIHWQMLQQPLVADLLRSESPITQDDLLPTLLSEEAESFSITMGMFDPEQCRTLLGQAEKLLMSHEGEPGLENAWARVKFLRSLVENLEENN